MRIVNIQKIFYVLFICIFYAPDILAESNKIPDVKTRLQRSSTNQQGTKVQATHITRQEIKESPVVNVSQLLERQQSIVRVTNNSMDSGQTALSIRGFGDNAAANSLILVDGFPLANVSLLTPNFNSISLSNIERIDIIQGSLGSLWGDQAVGGVLNIITRHPEKLIGDMQISLGNLHQRFFNGFIGDKFAHGFFIKAFGFANQSDGYRQHNNQNNNSFYAQTGFDYSRGTLHVNAQVSNNTTQFPGALTKAEFESHPRHATNHNDFSHYQTQVFQLLNKHELNENTILETRLAHNVISGDGFVSIGYYRKEWQNSFNPLIKTTLWGAKSLIGYEGQISQFDLTNSRMQQHTSAQQNNIYGQVIIPLLNQFDLTVGGRSAWQKNAVEGLIDSTNHVLVTEQGLSYRPSQTWQFFLRRDGNFRFPKANELAWLKPGENTLQVQTGVSYETGFVRKTEKHKTQLNVYQLELHDEIAFDPTTTPLEPMGRYSNFSTTQRRGITVAESYEVTPKFLIGSQVNYVNARFISGLFSGKHIPIVPAWNGNANFTYRFAENWRTKFSALYTGSQFVSLDLANQYKKIPAYWLESIALQYQKKSYEVSFEIDNLLNVNYPVFAVYNDFRKTTLYYPAAGRTYLLTLKASID